jgi:ribosomal protein S18 acetylase RimI-like enzyme
MGPVSGIGYGTAERPPPGGATGRQDAALLASMTTSSHSAEWLRLPGSADGAICRVGPEARSGAIVRLLCPPASPEPSVADRFLSVTAAAGISLDAMWILRDPAGEIVATVLAVPTPGRTAMIFASVPRTAAEVEPQARLAEHVYHELEALGVDIAQALLDPHEALQRDALLGAGFFVLADLSYLERSIPRAGRAGPASLPPGVTIEPFDDRHEADLIAVLDASYEETLDCPGLRGLRRTEDILAGHRATGAFDPALWSMLREDGRPTGAILLNPAPASNTIELVYIGVARRAQGRGRGRLLLRHGLHVVAGRGERAITLAVDERNEPALRLYRSEGFRRVARRIALVRSVRRPA